MTHYSINAGDFNRVNTTFDVVAEAVEQKPLWLFSSQPAVMGGLHHTSFSIEPTAIAVANALPFFRYDHTTISFAGGHSKGDNFVYAMAVPFDIDNSHSDNPADWITPEGMACRLQKLGVNFWMVSSRNHLLPKDGKAPRPKYHVYLPLSVPLHDSDKFVRYCEWCIRTFDADKQVKSKAQKLFGYGDNPHVFISYWSDGRFVDEVLSDDDLKSAIVPAVSQRESNTPVISSTPLHKMGHTAFDKFVESGDWCARLFDLEARGWGFFQWEEIVYFQTPDGDHSPGKQDGNIKDGVAYFFSKAPPPFENNKGYSICQFFAGALFGDTEKEGLAKFAKQYFQDEWELPQSVPEKIGIDVLDALLEQVHLISFSTPNEDKPKHSLFYIRSIDSLQYTATKHRWDIGVRNEVPYFYTGEFWLRIDPKSFRHFLQTVGMRQGIPYKTIRDHLFVDKLLKQFFSEARFPTLSGNDAPKINLRNGTLHFTPVGVELKPFDKQDGLCYQLPYAFDPSATAPRFRQFFERVQPDAAVRKLLCQYVAYIFLPKMNLEKILFLYGGGENGKSVFLDVIKALIGNEQCCAYTLEGITQSEYQRAELGNYLLNVSTEISTRMGGTDTFKKLASRETLQARHPYGRPFNVTSYATSIFSMNLLPTDVEQTRAYYRRLLVVPFDVFIAEAEKDTELATKIIGSEMPGVLNYVINGVNALLAERDFNIPPSIKETVDKYRLESDSVMSFLSENGFRPCAILYKPLREIYTAYRDQSIAGGYRPVSKTTFGQRLRNLGYNVSKIGKMHQTVVYVTQEPDYYAGGGNVSDTV